ncbi:hypothetical protein [Phenylobacterium sp.]|uniref:hypothetical protein n=1 Tax=Phenylobacterium sp. TaxID=1871053 RepID=UPI0040365B9B
MSAARPAAAVKSGMFKPGYEGVTPSSRLSPVEVAQFEARKDALVARLTDAMLTLSVLEADDPSGKGSAWPAYVREFGDLTGRDEESLREAETRPARFAAKPHHLESLLPTLALLDGLRPVYLKVLFLRAIGSYYGGFSFPAIGDRFGKTGEWARHTYEAVVIQAARRDGLLAPEPAGWAVLVTGVRSGGWRSYVTTARDPSHQLRDLKAKSPIVLEDAFALWTAGQPVAQRLAKQARVHLLGRATHGSWHRISPDDMADLLITEARKIRAEWSIENLPLGRLSGAVADDAA